jgi:hypothetical protein
VEALEAALAAPGGRVVGSPALAASVRELLAAAQGRRRGAEAEVEAGGAVKAEPGAGGAAGPVKPEPGAKPEPTGPAYVSCGGRLACAGCLLPRSLRRAAGRTHERPAARPQLSGLTSL